MCCVSSLPHNSRSMCGLHAQRCNGRPCIMQLRMQMSTQLPNAPAVATHSPACTPPSTQDVLRHGNRQHTCCAELCICHSMTHCMLSATLQKQLHAEHRACTTSLCVRSAAATAAGKHTHASCKMLALSLVCNRIEPALTRCCLAHSKLRQQATGHCPCKPEYLVCKHNQPSIIRSMQRTLYPAQF